MQPNELIHSLVTLGLSWNRIHAHPPKHRIYGNAMLKTKVSMGPFIYYVSTFLGFLNTPSPLHKHVFSAKNKQKLTFSDPTPPPYKRLRNI